MIKVAVVGAAGRMGQRLVANVMAAEDMTLAGALEAPASPAIGKDSGMVAGCGENGVKITASPEEALAALRQAEGEMPKRFRKLLLKAN